jgi:hypothetical protein
MKIKDFVKKFIISKIVFLVLRYIITAFNTLIGCFVLSILIDKILPLPIVVFHVYWFFIVFVLIIFFINLIYRIVSLFLQPHFVLQEELLKYNYLSHKDDFVNAYLLEQSLEYSNRVNFSLELATKFIEDVKKELIKVDFRKIVGNDRITKVLPLNFVLLFIIYILYIASPGLIRPSIHKILFTRRPEILGLYISPGNAKVQYKTSCEIKVSVEKEYDMYTPLLFIKTKDNKKFLKFSFDKIEQINRRKVYKYKIDSVEEEIFYKIKFRGIFSKVYIIQPIVSPEIIGFNIDVTPPAYTGIKSFNIKSFVETKFLQGSNIKFICETNKDISQVFMNINNNKIKLFINEKDKRKFYGSFVADNTTDLWFELYDEEGLHNYDNFKYKINVVEDKPPEIEIISPQNDIVVMLNSIVPIVYSVKDDISVDKVELVYKIQNKTGLYTIKVKKYIDKTLESIDDFMFDLSKIKLNYGDVIVYHLVVYDNDVLHGYKSDITDEYKIEIFSYEQQHQSIQKEIQQFIDKTSIVLEKEIELYDNLSKLTTQQINEINDLVKKNRQISKEFENLNSMLNSLLDKMSTDPYTSVDTYTEFKSLNSDLNNIINNVNPEFLNNLQKQNLAYASKLQQQIIDFLERATMLSEEIMKKQNMENIVSSINDASSDTKQLLDTLKGLSNKLSKEDMTKLENLLNEIADKLKKISELLNNMPQKLPQEFVNSREIKNLDFISPMQSIQNILNAISKGDIDTALELAQQLLNQLSSLTKNISETSSELLNLSNSFLKEQIDKLANKLDNLINKQEEIYQDTKKIDDYRIQQVFSYQEKMMEYIKEKIKDVLQQINNLLSYQSLKFITNYYLFYNNSLLTSGKLNAILSEIEMKQLVYTSMLIKESVSIWQQNSSIIEKQQNVDQEISKLTKQIELALIELDKLINKEPSIEYPKNIIDKNTNLYNKQNMLADETENFIKDLKQLGRKSFIINSEDVTLAIQAQNEMVSSAGSLNNKKFSDAVQYQNQALNYLLSLKNNLSSKQELIQQVMQKTGQSMGSTLQFKNTSGGKTGVLTGRVLLPSVKDYVPPKELREDIIKSLSEKYPEELQKFVEDYYKMLLK